MRRLAPRLDILPEAQRAFWQALAPLRPSGFVLYGGTAVALLLGHRTSLDFDFFTERHIAHDDLQAEFPFIRHCEILQAEPDTLVLSCPSEGGEIKLSLFGGISFGRIGEPSLTDDGVALVASPEDLLATKLKVIFQRAEAKDYRDIAALIRSGVPLEIGLAGARALFGKAFSPSECLRALTWFRDGDIHTLPEEDRRLLEETVAGVRALPHVTIASKRLAPGLEPRNDAPEP